MSRDYLGVIAAAFVGVFIEHFLVERVLFNDLNFVQYIGRAGAVALIGFLFAKYKNIRIGYTAVAIMILLQYIDAMS